MFHSAPKLTIISRPVFTEPEHLPVTWLGEASDGEKLAEFAGRLCYMSQRNPASRQTREYLENIKRQGHGSVLEHANYSVLAEGISRSLTHELVRHRAGWGYCLAGDTLIYSERRQGGKRNGPKKRTIKSIYERTLTSHGRSRLALILLRCLDEATGNFTTGRIAAVSQSGTKPVFRIELEDGKTITCSRDHRFLSSDGWKSLTDLVGGLSVSPKGLALTGELGEIMVNGTPAYKDREWLKEQYHVLGREQEDIAELAGVSKHCIRAWVRRHGLQKPMGSWTIGREPWNKGRRYVGGWHHTPENRAAFGASKRGAKNHAWRGGITPKGIVLRREVERLRLEILARDAYRCRLCGRDKARLVMHHVLPVWYRPDLAAEIDNIVTVCRTCHLQRLNQRELEYVEHFAPGMKLPDPLPQPPRGALPLLRGKLVRIVKVTYAGEQETYDIEMAGENHNFVANGIVTHNSQLSQRYGDESEAQFVIPPAIIDDPALEKAWKSQMESAQKVYVELVDQLMERYSWVADKVHRRKMAREAARGVLPNSTETKIVMTGNARAWRTMLELRSSEGAEMEIRRFAVTALRLMQEEAPGFFSDFEIYTADDRREAARIAYHKV
ncbi:MAG: FAD-dependent thymidylate synthase [Gemmatimonadaceae bacterium]